MSYKLSLIILLVTSFKTSICWCSTKGENDYTLIKFQDKNMKCIYDKNENGKSNKYLVYLPHTLCVICELEAYQQLYENFLKGKGIQMIIILPVIKNPIQIIHFIKSMNIDGKIYIDDKNKFYIDNKQVLSNKKKFECLLNNYRLIVKGNPYSSDSIYKQFSEYFTE